MNLSSFGRYWLPVLTYCLAIFIQSALPPANLLAAARFSDKLLHFGAYALLGALLWRALIHTWPNSPRRQLILVSTLASALYGLSDEIHQAFVPCATPTRWISCLMFWAAWPVLGWRLGSRVQGPAAPRFRN